jgi:hypothetical protein
MSEPRPIMCTLTAADLKDRGRAWRKLWASGLLHRQRVRGGIRLSADPGGAEALTELIELERECCSWIDYQLDGAAVTLTAEGEGEAVLAEMFGPG